MKIYAESTLKAKYRKLDLSQETVDLLHRYFSAFANLYGILPLADAYRIINKQNKNLLTFDQLYGFSDIVAHEEQYYFIVDSDEMWSDMPAKPETREIVAEHLLCIDEEDYYRMAEMQNGKPLFIPSKEELLRYEDEYYYEKTPRAIAVENFFKTKKNITGERLLDVMAEITGGMNIADDPVDHSLRSIARLGIELTDAEVIRIGNLLCDMSNNYRMQANRGYTPTELSHLIPKSKTPPTVVLGDNIKSLLKSGEISITDMQNEIITSGYPKETKLNLLSQLAEIQGIQPPKEKISKNSLCPCGSGKKYKRCCGKNE